MTIRFGDDNVASKTHSVDDGDSGDGVGGNDDDESDIMGW